MDIKETNLNRKLAEWAGWYDFNKDGCGYPPNATAKQPRLYPIFTTSLDACFKWLVPKLKRWEMGNNAESCAYFIASLADTKYPAKTQAETPSMALCLAIDEADK